MPSKYSSEAIASAINCQTKTNVPAVVTLAQFDQESSCGKHMPIGSNNPFGIKAVAGQPFVSAMTWEIQKGQAVRVSQNFAKYESLDAAFEAHGALLNKPAYAAAITAWKAGDLNGGIDAMAKKYATDPDYAAKLKSIIVNDHLDVLVKTGLSGAPSPSKVTPAAPTAAQPQSEGVTMESILASLFGNFGTSVSSIATVATYIPEVASGVLKAAPDAVAFEKAVATFIADMVAGKIGNVGTDLPAIFTAFEKLLEDFGVTHTAVPNATKKLVEAPAISTLKSATTGVTSGL